MLLDLSYQWLALIVFSTYNLLFVLFALLWTTIKMSCNFGEETTFLDAYYFSIETMMTIGSARIWGHCKRQVYYSAYFHILGRLSSGYSAPDAFFGECWSGIGVLMTESLAGLLMNSFTLTLLYQVCNLVLYWWRTSSLPCPMFTQALCCTCMPFEEDIARPASKQHCGLWSEGQHFGSQQQALLSGESV